MQRSEQQDYSNDRYTANLVLTRGLIKNSVGRKEDRPISIRHKSTIVELFFATLREREREGNGSMNRTYLKLNQDPTAVANRMKR